MIRTTLLSIACLCALSACNVSAPGPTDTPSPATSATASAPAPAPEISTVAPAGNPAQEAVATDARFDGYGDMRFGMTAAEATKAWAGTLAGADDAAEPCYHLTPQWAKDGAEFAFMIEDDRFVRYSTRSARFTAPGGGKVGMTTAQIEALYAGRIERLPHKYTDGKYLRIKDEANANRAVLFETDAAGTVTAWRAGVAPQVDYVEGCA